jgi:uncharacterized protein
MPSLPRFVIAAVIALGILVATLALSDAYPRNRDLALSLALGAMLGVVLQRGRFCFLCNLRDFFSTGSANGLIAILIALAVGAVGYHLVFGAWMPTVSPTRLPPTAHIGPITLILPIAALVFGIGMGLSGSCLSGHLYRLGEGSPTAPFALIGSCIGFGLGFLSWNTIYIAMISGAPSLWLPHSLGYAGALAVTLGALLLLSLLVLYAAKAQPLPVVITEYPLKAAACAVFITRWPASVTGVLVGMIATLAYFRTAPLGVTAELGSLVRTGAASIGALPETLHGLDAFRGCATAVKTALLSPNGLLVVGLVGGSFASALLSGQFTPSRPTARQMIDGTLGGIMMGWGAMTGLGCTVGVLLSGIHAGAVSGWVFLAACVIGAWIGIRLKSRLSPAQA